MVKLGERWIIMVGERMAFSPQEAAMTLGLCLNSVYKMLKRGQLRGVKVDRKILIPKSELARLLSGNQNPPSGPANA
jgi:excisionase family DNA binding protein